MVTTLVAETKDLDERSSQKFDSLSRRKILDHLVGDLAAAGPSPFHRRLRLLHKIADKKRMR